MKKIDRAIVIVLDGAGIGALPDAADFGDEGSNTIGNIFMRRGFLNIPNMLALGLGNIEGSLLPRVEEPIGAHGRMAAKTKSKDTTGGHWELACLIMEKPFRTYPGGFPDDLLIEWLLSAGREAIWLGNCAASGTEIIERLGGEHIKTAAPIVYTSADSVFQVAAHEGVININEQYRLCEAARKILDGGFDVGRVIARPFNGEPGAFKRTKNRRDFAVPPIGETILDGLEALGKKTLGIGKIEDIFCRRGVSRVDHTTSNAEGIDATIVAIQNDCECGFIFTNLVDFDMLYGHRNDVEGFARALEYFDSRLPEITDSMRENDLLFITADHGCDPTTDSTDHSREYAPVLAYGKNISPENLGTRRSYADLGATVFEALAGREWGAGESFLNALY